MNITPTQQRWMVAAQALGRRAMGNSGANPAVGCVLVSRDGALAGQGWTQAGGRPHAEIVALEQAGSTAARGGTAFVTLEPCAHLGRSGRACAQALVDAGVAAVHIGIADPDAQVAGRGIDILRTAGLAVVMHNSPAIAWDLAGYLRHRRIGRPLVTLKLATTLDGKIALGHGESKWITGPLARRWGHLVRAQHDAIVTGARTVRADDPALTARVPGLPPGQSPKPYVLSSANGLDGPYQVLARGELIRASGSARLPKPDAVLDKLGGLGHTRVMIEAGSGVAALFLRPGLVDQIALFQAPSFIGRDGLNAIGSLSLGSLADMTRWDVLSHQAIADERFVRLRNPAWGDEVTSYV